MNAAITVYSRGRVYDNDILDEVYASEAHFKANTLLMKLLVDLSFAPQLIMFASDNMYYISYFQSR